MAAQSSLSKSALVIKYVSCIDAKGNELTKTKKFTNVKVAATTQNIYDVAQALAPFMKYQVAETVRTDNSIIFNV